MTNHPHAWFWQELNSSPNFPWHRRAYVTAIEPASTIPGQGLERALAEGQHVMRLEPDQASTFVISAQIEGKKGE